MSQLLINQYYKELAKVKQRGNTRNESSISIPFYNLLNQYCQTKGFSLISQLTYQDKKIRPDGTIRDDLGLDWGYWESKDEDDDLDQEIENKFSLGYPNDNILFEDSQTAVLIQAGREVMRVAMKDSNALDKILKQFIDYQRPEVAEFYQAIDKFKQDLPTIIITLRDKIDQASSNNQNFIIKRDNFLKICQESINPNITAEDIREMMIQHILTEDIFLTIFDEAQFHRDNNIARELTELINTFLKGAARKQLLSTIQHYYAVIKRKASQISNHHDKQQFLKSVYENFYKAYNPKAADRLGIVYTPNEIVKFMVESVDYLCHQHFGKFLEDQGVEILDPATGTGTFITEIIEYLNPDKLKYKYQNEIHCNEVSILPYYIANLNIEATYMQKMGEYVEFENICFVDTLDHTAFHLKQMDLFAISVENTARIFRQNDRNISVIIGNPPYNARQENENDNNKNREYPAIDKRIKATYVKESKAQKSNAYDMYSRFFRWATDRLSNNGIIAFITNSSFIDSKSFNGFRKVVADEFDYIYIVDLGGNIRAGDKTGNVFNIMIGVAITFLVKKASKNNSNKLPCQIRYFYPEDVNSGLEKLDFLAKTSINNIPFIHIQPDDQYNWINLTDNDFNEFIPLFDKNSNIKTLFSLYSNGVMTNRDEWVYDFDTKILAEKCQFFIKEYNDEVERWIKYKKDNNYVDIKKESNLIVDQFLAERNIIKWSKMIKRDKLRKEKKGKFRKSKIVRVLYRPFCDKYLYFDYIAIDIVGKQLDIFSDNIDQRNFENNRDNIIICLSGLFSNNDFHCLASNCLVDRHFNGDSQCFPLYRYENGNRIENITDWGLQQFNLYYNNNSSVGQASSLSPSQDNNRKDNNNNRQDACSTRDIITKEDIFYYVYAVLHNPEYRKKYELNLKREFPRIPFYDDFFKWVNWGKKLMELHLNYETIDPYPLNIQTADVLKKSAVSPPPLKGGLGGVKPKLKADKIKGEIILDDITTLTGIPQEAWEYKLGNRSALEWILDQYKEKKPKDPTIAERFNTYRFADYKEKVIDLLMRVTTVSVETIKIINQMT